MDSFNARLKHHTPALTLAMLHWLASFWLEKRVLEVPPNANLFNYVLCKGILLFALTAFWTFLEAVFRPVDARKRARWVFIFSVPYLAILTAWLFTHHSFSLVSDELNIFLDAVRLESYAYWFNYFTGFYWIICLMAVPTAMGPVFVKMLLQALVCGYCMARERERGSWISALPVYLLFCLPFVLEQGISAHRLPTYGMLYLAVAAKLIYDREVIEDAAAKEKDSPKPDGYSLPMISNLRLSSLLLLSAAFGVLAIWRSEGIYFVPLGLILLLCAYKIRDRKDVLKTAACYVLVLAIVAVPQIKSYFFEDNPSVALRTKPFMAYAITIMMRNGLTEDMIGEEAKEMEPFLPIETIEAANEEYGEAIYGGAFALRKAKQAPYPDQERFCDAVKRVILKYPGIYIKSQLTAFRHVDGNSPYREGMSLWQRIEAFSWHVSLPAALSLLFTLYFLLKKKWLPFWLGLGSLGNFVLVVALMPATFPKYFYLTYLYGYYMLTCALCRALRRGTAK